MSLVHYAGKYDVFPLVLAKNILQSFQSTKENIFALFRPLFYLFKFHLPCDFTYSFPFECNKQLT